MLRTTSFLVIAILIVLFAVACEGQSTTLPPPAATVAQPPAPTAAGAHPTPTSAPVASPATAPATSPAVAQETPPSAPPSSAAPAVTEDDHYYLGAADAPVTMIDFSDFM